MKILFMGRKRYGAQMLEWTVRQGNDVLAVVTDNHYHNSPTTAMAEKLKIPIVSYDKACEIVENNNLDLIVSYLYWKKIKEPFISKPKYGCINFHPAILPDWKGMGGYNIAILNKLKEWGATAHLVDDNIDTGPIIKIFRFDFDYKLETARTLEEKTQKIQCDLYKSVLTALMENGGYDEPFIDNTGGTYISKKEMLNMMRVLPGDDIESKIRAFWFPPYHGAYIEINGEKYTLVNDFILRSLKDNDQTAL